MTLLSLLDSNHSLNIGELVGSGYTELNGSGHINDHMNDKKLPQLDVFKPHKIVAVTNGSLVNCYRADSEQKYLKSTLGVVCRRSDGFFEIIILASF